MVLNKGGFVLWDSGNHDFFFFLTFEYEKQTYLVQALSY